MIDTVYKIVAFAITLGVLVVFHELGHYAIARLAGVKVLRFSVGFGRLVWSRRFGRDQTEWALSAIPLGGYVKMADEREGHVDAADLSRAFNRQSVWRRIAIVAAGPLANLLLAVLLFAGTFVAGVPGQRALLAEPPPSTTIASRFRSFATTSTASRSAANCRLPASAPKTGKATRCRRLACAPISARRSSTRCFQASPRSARGSSTATGFSPSTAGRCVRRATSRR